MITMHRNNRHSQPVVRSLTVLATGAFALVLSAGLASCGGSGISQQDVSNAAAQASQEAKLKALKDQVQALQRQGGVSPSAPSTSGSSGGSDSGGRDCGSGVVALNSVTTCPFALNVASTYYSSGQQGTVDVYSPVTDQHYTMSCTAGHPHTCSGGNDAQVSVP
jgi:hypothetical protein